MDVDTEDEKENELTFSVFKYLEKDYKRTYYGIDDSYNKFECLKNGSIVQIPLPRRNLNLKLMIASNSNSIEVYIQMMSGDIFSVSFSKNIDIDDFYKLVQQALPEPHPHISSLRLMINSKDQDSKDEDSKEDFSPLLNISDIRDKDTIFLFIEDLNFRVEIRYHQHAVVESYFRRNEQPRLFMEGETFKEYLITVYESDELLFTVPFFTLVRNDELDDNKELYSDVYYHKDDIKFEVSRSMRWNSLDEDMISIKDDAICVSSPGSLAEEFYYKFGKKIDAISYRIHQVWMEMVKRESDGILHSYYDELVDKYQEQFD